MKQQKNKISINIVQNNKQWHKPALKKLEIKETLGGRRRSNKEAGRAWYPS